MKKYLLLLALVCLLGNRALAQNRTTYTTTILEVKKTIDFTGWIGVSGDTGDNPEAEITWNNNQIVSIKATNTDGDPETRNYDNISVANGGNGWNSRWHLWRGSHGLTYLQKNESDDSFYISGLEAGDVVCIWGDNGNNNGGFKVGSNNTDVPTNDNITFGSNHRASRDITMRSSGTLQLNFYGSYSGILKIEIKNPVEQDITFDYDPGYEEYDMYDDNSNTSYTTSPAGFSLNEQPAQYITFSGSKITANNRIALNRGDWTFDFGLVPPGNDGDYSYLSVCNLREGDRVVISYINDGENPLIFASGSKFNEDTNSYEFYYDGCTAFKDENRDGVFNNGDMNVTDPGEVVAVEWQRGDGNISQTINNQIRYINSYVITQDGHLDLAFKKMPNCRIIKIKIYSDHQAMMVDKYESHAYTAYFNITGELQAKEHIMPGGLEIHVGNDVASQHAIVVSSKDGPVSYVNAVDGYKIPGVEKSSDGSYYIPKFDLNTSIPTTGTFYRFIPEVSGKMTVKFEAKSMNYYRWDLTGNATYYANNWTVLNDRPNEQTLDVVCPYYLVKEYTDNEGNLQREFTPIGNESGNGVSNGVKNGHDFTTATISVNVGETYYLYGGWNNNVSNLYFNGSFNGNIVEDNNHQKNNIEFAPQFPTQTHTTACGIAQLLWVKFERDKSIYPLAKWVPNGTAAVNDETGEDGEDHGVPNPDTFEKEYELATVVGYDDTDLITVKKYFGNITGCEPYFKFDTNSGQGGSGKLMIKNITFGSGNQGGTILLKIGDPTDRNAPLYALTVAYSAGVDDSNTSRGHLWDFFTKSLSGLEWENPAVKTYKTVNGEQVPESYVGNDAERKPLGTYFDNYYGKYGNEEPSSSFETITGYDKNENSLLYKEITTHDDWLFNYNLKYDNYMYDPVFSNKYDMEGDNADMICETEGTVFQTSANQSVMFNEFTNVNNGNVQHTESNDPNRYVGILKGGEFRIPWLEKDDRVIIWMGTGKGRTNDQVVFNIKGAYDAVHKKILETDDYVVGGSHWDGEKGDSYYRGCYHFFAQGGPTVNGKTMPADMVFTMKGGEMCKLYKIQIYRGDRIITNEIVDKAATENQFLLYSTAADPNEDPSETNKDYTDNTTHEWALQYLGKDQQLANGTGKNYQKNEIIAKTGKYNSATPALTNNRVDPEDNNSEVVSFTYQNQFGEIGTFRMRGKDMEKNMNYVADYADHNVTIAYQQTQPYPYTWDFTDVTGIAENVTKLFDPEEKLGETIKSTTKPDGLTDEEWADIWGSLDDKSYQKTSRDLSLWEVKGTAGNYFLRLNSQESQTPQNLMERDNIFESAKEIGGNQVWANKTIVPEMKGLWFYTENYDPETRKSYDNYQGNGEWIIKQSDEDNPAGLEFAKGYCDWFNKIVVPNVPKNAAVYLRMRKLTTTTAKVKYMFGQQESMSELPKNTTSTSGTTNITETLYSIGNGDYIMAIMNTTGSKSNLTLSLDGFRVQKLAVSTDPKAIGKTGYATESRARRIDHTLTSFLTGKDIKAYTASYGKTASSTTPDYSRVVLKEFDKPSLSGSTDGQENGGCILYHNGGTSTDRSVEILDKGFHLFVPDMHDGKDADGNDITTNDVDISNNILISFNPKNDAYTLANLATGYILPDAKDGQKTLVLSAKKYRYGTDGSTVDEGFDVSFIRVDPKGNDNRGASIKDCSAYIKMPASQMKVLSDKNHEAKAIIVFFDEMFGEINNGIATGISEANEENAVNGKAEWYSLDGQKLNGVPTAKGLYIVNGKKVLVK